MAYLAFLDKSLVFFKNLFIKPKSLLFVSLAVFFIFGFNHLANFISADEHFWLPNSGSERIADYWEAIGKGDWKDTRVNDKPGITLAWTSGIAMLFDDAKTQIVASDHTFKQFDPAETKKINFLYRLPILILSGLFSLFFFWIIKKITEDEWVALMSATGILLSPVLLGISQIVNPDSLFWIFGAASFFSFYAWLQKGEKKLAIFSSLFLGLALASKYVSVIFFPFFFFMLVAYFFFNYEPWQARPDEFSKIILKKCLAYIGVIAGGMLLFAILMPASFVEPKVFYAGTIGFPGMQPIFWSAMALNILIILDSLFFKSRFLRFLFEKLEIVRKHTPKIIFFILAGTATFVLINWLTRQGIVELSGVSFDTKTKDSFSHLPYLTRYASEFVPLIFSLTPIALFSLIYLWIKGIFKKLPHAPFVFILSTFYLIFYAAVIEQGLLVTVRYSIILFPLSAVLSAIAILDFFRSDWDKKARQALLVFSAVFSITLVWQILNLVQFYLLSVNAQKNFIKFVYRTETSNILFIAAAGVLTFVIYQYFPREKIKKISSIGIYAGTIILSVFSLWLISPFYFSYTSELLPKNYIISGAWGYGGYEAAEQLNRLPDAEKLTVWADAYGFCEFFKGKCIHKAKVNTTKYPIDYYFQSLQSTLPMNFPHPMETHSFWSIYVDGRTKSYVKLYKAKPGENAPDPSINLNEEKIEDETDE
jgi:hypothetical protein